MTGMRNVSSVHMPMQGPAAHTVDVRFPGADDRTAALTGVLGYTDGTIDTLWFTTEAIFITLDATPTGLVPLDPENRHMREYNWNSTVDVIQTHLSGPQAQERFATHLRTFFHMRSTDRAVADTEEFAAGHVGTLLAAASVLTDDTDHAAVALAMVKGGYTGPVDTLLTAARAALTSQPASPVRKDAAA